MPEITVNTTPEPIVQTTPELPLTEIIEIAKTSGENSSDIDNLEEKTEDLEDKTIALENQLKWAGTDIALFNDRLSNLELRLATLEAKEEAEEENLMGIHESETTEISPRTEEIPVKAKHNFFF